MSHQLFKVVPGSLENSWINATPSIFLCFNNVSNDIKTAAATTEDAVA